ncbi:MAG: type II toxin-antitoxin system RelE/ParE family toxin [Nitrospirae bacterium]|nr:type II toxin-antitoxin system RelE/ParE family toxin [Nitrospirota bacterium]
MIKSFEHKGLENYFYNGTKKGIQAQHAQKLGDILDRLDAAKDVTDMKYPGSDLHQLKGKMKGLWAVRVSGNWRVIFSFKEANAYDVNYIDYH